MDGTLLRDDATISPYSHHALTKILEENIPFTIASARSVTAIRQVLGQLPLRLPVIAVNGALISDYHTGEHIVINDISKGLLEDIYGRIMAHGSWPFMATFDGSDDRFYHSQIINGGMEIYHQDRVASGDKRLTGVDNLTKKFADQVISFTVINTHDKLKPLADELEEELGSHLENHFFENPYSPGWWWLTIHDKKACKSVAIRELLEYADFSMDDLVVFGDNLNDVKMFRTTNDAGGNAVAVGNATDEIKQYATTIIGTNQDDSVVKYIARQTNMYG